jgi:hypothetical protein
MGDAVAVPLDWTGMGTLPIDWYRSTFSGDTRGRFWEDDAAEKVTRALRILRPSGRERVLDLACTTGQRTLELSGREASGDDAKLVEYERMFVERFRRRPNGGV